MENKLSKFVTGFRKLHGTQHAMVIMLEKKSSRQKRLYLRLIFGSIKGL